jgi:CelD/BcsL family acetyltransferase involved in cellulose biosynthesis
LALAPVFADGAEMRSLAHQACPRLVWRAGEDPVAQAPSRRRRQLRRAFALAERRGQLRFERASFRDSFLDELIRLHGLRWESRSERGVLADARVARFHAAALPRLEAAGLSRCYLLRIDERCAGAFYGLSDTRAVYAYLGGFDPDFSYESPGALLIAHALTDAAREGALAFDFLRGQEPYKYGWGARDRWTLRLAATRGERHDVGLRAAG